MALETTGLSATRGWSVSPCDTHTNAAMAGLPHLTGSVAGLGQVQQGSANPRMVLFTAGQPELDEDRVDVLFHGVPGEEQFLGDAGVGVSAGDAAEHLTLPRAQPGQPGVMGAGPDRDQGLDDLAVECRTACVHV